MAKYKQLYLDATEELQDEVSKNVELETKFRSLQNVLAKHGERFLTMNTFTGLNEIRVDDLTYVCIAACLEKNKRYSGAEEVDYSFCYSWKGIPIQVTENE